MILLEQKLERSSLGCKWQKVREKSIIWLRRYFIRIEKMMMNGKRNCLLIIDCLFIQKQLTANSLQSDHFLLSPYPPGNNMKKIVKTCPAVAQYVLKDYQFLQDYEILDCPISTSQKFIANIINTTQKVKFHKIPFTPQHFARFEALYQLFKDGIVLADNMFISEECGQVYYYIIEAYLQINNPRFITLKKYLHHNQEMTLKEKGSFIGKIKVLLDCLHQLGQPFSGLSPANIVVDDEGQLYLKPFELSLQLSNVNQVRSYYSPEILSLMENNIADVVEESMLKWDIWAFGCICLQIMQYSSPYFMATSIRSQLHQIDLFSLDQEEWSDKEIQEPLHNMISNSLEKECQLRNISIKRFPVNNASLPHSIKKIHQIPENQNRYIRQGIESKSNNSFTETKKVIESSLPKSGVLRQLNLHYGQEDGDCQFTLNLFTISNVNFQKELQLTIDFNRKYHFFIDFDEQKSSSKPYSLLRKISLRGNFQFFSSLLSNPLTIELKEDDKASQVDVNLQTLIIVYDGKRVWDQPLLGTYQALKEGGLGKVKVRLSCSLKTPSIIKDYEFDKGQELKENFDIKTNTTDDNNVKNKERRSTELNKKKKQTEMRQAPPSSIRKITDDLSSLADHWRKKNQSNQTPNNGNEMKMKICQLLQMG